jgi:DcrB
MPAMPMANSRWRSCRRQRPAARPTGRRCLRGRVAAVGGALLVATLGASCASDDDPGATANPLSTTSAATAGQTVRGTGYRFSLPAGWRDGTTEAKKTFTEKIDAAVIGPQTGGFSPNVIIASDPYRGLALADHLAATRKEQAEVWQDPRHLGQPEPLSLAGTPALVHEYTYMLEGRPLHGRQVACLRSDRVLFVTLTADPETFATDRAALDQIITSWSWG